MGVFMGDSNLKYRARLKPIIVLVGGLCAQAALPAAPQKDAATRETAFYYAFLEALTEGHP
jgi:hypothetical protein